MLSDVPMTIATNTGYFCECRRFRRRSQDGLPINDRFELNLSSKLGRSPAAAPVFSLGPGYFTCAQPSRQPTRKRFLTAGCGAPGDC